MAWTFVALRLPLLAWLRETRAWARSTGLESVKWFGAQAGITGSERACNSDTHMRLSPATEVADTGDVRLADVRVDSTVRGRPVNSLWKTSKHARIGGIGISETQLRLKKRRGDRWGQDGQRDRRITDPPILSPTHPYLALRDTLCSCEAYRMRPKRTSSRRCSSFAHRPRPQ